MKQIILSNWEMFNLCELSEQECLQFEGGSWIGDIGEAVGGALGFVSGATVRVVSEAAKIITGPLINWGMR